MNVSRFLLKCSKLRKVFLLIGMIVYFVLHYQMISGLDSDVDERVHNDPKKHFQSDSKKTQISRKHASMLQRAPSIDYFACCGAGHRMSKLADAYYLAKQLEFTVRVFFGFCGHQEVFSHLFEPRPINQAQILEKIKAAASEGNHMYTMPDMYIKVSNDVPGFRKIKRVGRSSESNTTACPCHGSVGQRFDSDIEIFSDLRDNRFRGRDKVNDFRQRYFSGHTVIGLHVRAGNGEKGDFERKK